MNKLWVVCAHTERYELRYWWEYGDVKNKNRLVERKALLDTVGIGCADLKDKLVHDSCDFPCYADCHVLLSVTREIKMFSHWFGCMFIVFLYVMKLFTEAIA